MSKPDKPKPTRIGSFDEAGWARLHKRAPELFARLEAFVAVTDALPGVRRLLPSIVS